jgi:hypothetical protein
MKKDEEWKATFALKYDEYCQREFERLTVKKGPRPPKLAQA